MENNELQVCHKNRTCYYFDDIIKIEDFDSDNVLFNEKSNKSISIYDISYKTVIGAKTLRIMFNKVNGFIRGYNTTNYLVFLALKKIMPFLIGLDLIGSKSYITYVFRLKNQN